VQFFAKSETESIILPETHYTQKDAGFEMADKHLAVVRELVNGLCGDSRPRLSAERSSRIVPSHIRLR